MAFLLLALLTQPTIPLAVIASQAVITLIIHHHVVHWADLNALIISILKMVLQFPATGLGALETARLTFDALIVLTVQIKTLLANLALI